MFSVFLILSILLFLTNSLSLSAQPLLTCCAQNLLMGYTTVFELVEMAKRYNLLGESMIKSMIMTVALLDDPELEHDAAEYIGYRALENIFSGYRGNHQNR